MKISILNFEIKGDERGSLISLEENKNIPFDIKRVYYIFGTKEGVRRGFHAHNNLRQILIAVSGICKILLDDGEKKSEVILNSSSKGLIVEPMIWHEMFDFSPDCVLTVLADGFYDESDYIRNYDEFKKQVKAIVLGKNINLRLAKTDDAAFILNLRLEKGEHLSSTQNDLSQQIKWLESYKVREEDGLEYYFIIEDKSGLKLGVVRLYDFKHDSFCWGSWIIKDGAPILASIESALLVYKFAFEKLGFTRSHFDVRKNNKNVVGFHQRFGATIVSENELNYFFSYNKSDHEKTKKKYAKYL